MSAPKAASMNCGFPVFQSTTLAVYHEQLYAVDGKPQCCCCEIKASYGNDV